MASCEEDDAAPQCSIPATVRDLRGLDGCTFVFELEDGTRLEPQIRYYINGCYATPTPFNGIRPPEDDPLFNFEFVNGKKVLIEYEEVDAPSICMVGQTVEITCITEVGMEEPDPQW